MEIQNTVIIEKAARIIMNSGLQKLTIPNLADELNVKQRQLYTLLTKDDDILLMLLLSFKTDINDFLTELIPNTETPETELSILFKKLYFLFQQKPYYLHIIFDKNLKERDINIKKTILWIRNMAENYLTSVITKGKKENTFKIKESTKSLVGKMLSGFRLFMKDEQRINEMILEMKSLKTSKD